IVEVLLGVRMPRRPVHPGESGSRSMKERIKEVFTDPRTWSTLLYMVLQLVFGVIYFVLAVTFTAVSLSLIFAPIEAIIPGAHFLWISWDDEQYMLPWIFTPLMTVLGVIVLTCLMHLARGIGYFHGHLAKNLLVKAG
ncbi:MAG TPA: sensor domain-containing protein, partial [Gammaproteobacteria bacterium]|nr:sensor domain-containing protein [Gammaproteobacteria bacterium]